MPEYATGPGRHTRSRGAVIDTYAVTGADKAHCPKAKGGCGAVPGGLCHHPNGVERRMPCPVRIPPRPEPDEPGEAL